MTIECGGNTVLETPSIAARGSTVLVGLLWDGTSNRIPISQHFGSGSRIQFYIDGGVINCSFGFSAVYFGTIAPGQQYYFGWVCESDGTCRPFIGARRFGGKYRVWISDTSFSVSASSGAIAIGGLDPNVIGFGLTLGIYGDLSRCTIWDSAVDAATIEAAMDADSGVPAGAWAHYELADAATHLDDTSGNSRDATPFGGTSTPTDGAPVVDPPDPNAAGLIISCVGNSITEGYGVTTPYPTTLQTLRPGDTVTNFGHAGWKVAECRGTVYGDVLPTFDSTIANVVLFSEWTNDTIAGGFTAAQHVAHCEDIVRFCQARGLYVVMWTPFPAVPGDEGNRATVSAAIMALDMGHDFAIDVGNDPAWDDPSDTSDYNADGVHLTQATTDAQAGYLDDGLTAWLASLSAGGGATIALDQGSYAVTGQTISLLRGLRLGCAQGSITLTGQSVALKRGRAIACTQGAYANTGQPVALLVGRRIALASSSYAVSGQTTVLKRGLRLAVDQATYACSGQSVTLVAPDADVTISCSQGAYTSTGQATGLRWGHRCAPDSGSYSVAGQALGLRRGLRGAIDPGAYALTGQAVALRFNRLLALAAGSYALTGQSVGLVRALRLVLVQGTYSSSGQAVALLRALRVVLAQGAYATTGQTAALLRGLRLSVAQGGYTVTGQAVALQRALRIALASGSHALVGQALAAIWTHRIVVAQGSYGLTGLDVGLFQSSDLRLQVSAGAYSVTGQALALRWTHVLQLVQGSYAVVGQAASLKRGLRAALNQGGYVLTGQDVAFPRTRRTILEQGGYAVAGQAMTGRSARRVPLDQGIYDLDGTDAAFLRGLRVALTRGLYALTGQDVAFDHYEILGLVADPGIYVLTGHPVGLTAREAYKSVITTAFTPHTALSLVAFTPRTTPTSRIQ